jgi:diphthamide biosynthesis methyltransferase
VYSSLLIAAQKKRCEAAEDGVDVRHTQPQSIVCGVGASVSRIELYNYDRIVSFVYVLYVILSMLFTYVYYMHET